MPAFQIIFAVTVTLTVLSGATAALIVALGDTRRNAGQRIVAGRLAHIALLGAAAIASLLTVL